MNWTSHTTPYLAAATMAYIAVQLSGLILIGIAIGLLCLNNTFLDASTTVPLAIMIGAMMTCIPTAVYALVLPAVILITQRLTKSVIAVFGVTSLLTIIIFLAAKWVTELRAAKPSEINDLWSLTLIIFAFPPGWLGTHVVRKMIAQQKPAP